MEPELLPGEEPVKPSTGCVVCHHPIIEQGHATALCSDCRSKFIRYPIPLFMKIFGVVIVLMLGYAMFSLPKSLAAGVHFERGKAAAESHKYVTAERELALTLKEVPAFDEALEYMAITCFRNGDLSAFATIMDKLDGKEVKDQALYEEITRMSSSGMNYFPSDSFVAVAKRYSSLDSIPTEVYVDYLRSQPEELFPATRYASRMFDEDKDAVCDSMLNLALLVDPNYLSALYLKTSIKQKLAQYDSSHHYCQRILSLNRESGFGMAARARTFLRQKEYKPGLDWALNSNRIDPQDGYSRATLALAYHFNDRKAERDKMINACRNDSDAMTYMQYAIDVVEGKEKFIY